MQKIIDGVSLAYDVAGSGAAVVLLHGFGLDRTVWDAQFTALAARGRAIRLDARGSGESACGDGPALMETLAGDVFGLLEALDVERAAIVGHGMGGYVALAFFRMYAERVAGLGLIASQVCADSAQRSTERDALIAALEARGIDAALDAYLPHALGPRSDSHGLLERVKSIVSRQSAAGAAAQLAGIKERVDSEDLLEDIRVPATIVAGDADAWLLIAAAEQTAAALADCRVERLAGIGHLPMLEAPGATTAAIAALLTRCAISGAADPRTARATRA
jgi:3-oxoadipate enol-lactonase